MIRVQNDLDLFLCQKTLLQNNLPDALACLLRFLHESGGYVITDAGSMP